LVDIDGDGHRDILSGSYSCTEREEAGLLYVLYGKPDGTFRKAEVLKGTDGQPLTIPAKGDKICTRPFAVDWDGDGHLDLVVGNAAGTFYWFKGQGRGKFLPRPELIKAGGAPLRIKGRHSDPFVIDLDGDGSLDLVSGSSDGGVYWARNKAGKGKVPDLEPFRQLVKPGQPINALAGRPDWIRAGDLTGPMRAIRVWVADVNGDGKPDLLVGDCVTLVSPAKGITDAEFKEKFAAWERDLKAVLAAGDAAGDVKSRKKAAEEFHEVYSRRTEFMNEDQTGFVWLYLRK
jgi:hypothetical protein